MTESSTAFVEVGSSLEPLRSPFLMALGERVRNLRSRKGMTRKAVALAADVSERHLANLEYGTGNVSVLVLLQVSHALQCSLAELLGDISTSSPEWLLIRELLSKRTEADLRRARVQLTEMFGESGDATARRTRIALIGLRGAGKTTLIRIITRILYPDSGTVLFNGEMLNDKHTERIGYMPEERGLYKKMKVGEHLIYLGRLKGLSLAQSKETVQHWLKKFEISLMFQVLALWLS